MSSGSASSAQIYVCKSRTCRRYGSDATLIEIEELVHLVKSDCTLDVEKTSCLGYCSQGPAVAVRKTVQVQVQGGGGGGGSFPFSSSKNKNKRRSKVTTRVHTKINTLQKSKTIVEIATGQRINLNQIPPDSESRLAEIKTQKQIEFFTSTYQWNKALSVIISSLIGGGGGSGGERRGTRNKKNKTLWSALETILDNAGYPWVDPQELVLEQHQSYNNRIVVVDGGGDNRDSNNIHNVRRSYNRSQLAVIPADIVIEKYVPWMLDSVEVVTHHSAVFKFITKDPKRSTPHPRGRGRRAEPITWHVTMLGETGGRNKNTDTEGPLPWIERDYTPISTALDWEQGKCNILIKIYNDGTLTSWLHQQTKTKHHHHLDEKKNCGTISSTTPPQSQSPTTRIWLSVPIKTLAVPSLRSDDDHSSYPSPASILLLLAGTGIVALPQIMAHRDPYNKLGIATPSYAQLPQCPIDLIHSCRADDILLLPEIKEYCLEHTKYPNPKKFHGLRNYTLLLTNGSSSSSSSSTEEAPYGHFFQRREENHNNHDSSIGRDSSILMAMKNDVISNAKVLEAYRLDLQIVSGAIDKLKEPYRIVVSGPDAYNSATKGFLDDCNVDPSQVTMLSV